MALQISTPHAERNRRGRGHFVSHTHTEVKSEKPRTMAIYGEGGKYQKRRRCEKTSATSQSSEEPPHRCSTHPLPPEPRMEVLRVEAMILPPLLPEFAHVVPFPRVQSAGDKMNLRRPFPIQKKHGNTTNLIRVEPQILQLRLC